MKLREIVITIRIEDHDDVPLNLSIAEAKTATREALEGLAFDVVSVKAAGREVVPS